MSTSIWFPSDFLSLSVKTNQAPSLPFPSLHVHVLSNWKDTSCLHWEHWSEIWFSVELRFRVLVFSRLQGHCLLTPNPKGRIPGCVHLKYVVIPGWYWMMSVWAPRVWWSERKLVNLVRSKTNWDTAQSIMNFWVVVGWKLCWEKQRIFSKRPLGALTSESCHHPTRLDTHIFAKLLIWSLDSLWFEIAPHDKRLRMFFLLFFKRVWNRSLKIALNT